MAGDKTKWSPIQVVTGPTVDELRWSEVDHVDH